MLTRRAIQLCRTQLLRRAAFWLPGCVATMLLPVALWCAGSSLLLAQESGAVQVYSGPPQSSTVPNSTERFSITGSVIDAVTGEPVRKALVQLDLGRQLTTFSDGDGRFQFENIPAGTYSVSAQKPGYFSQQELLRGAAPAVEVSPSSPSALVKLFPEAVISGKVTNSSGVPIERLTVNLTGIEIRDGRRRLENNRSAITDEDGRYRFANLRPQIYYLSAGPYTPLAETIVDAEERPDFGYPGVYFPGVPDFNSATPLSLSPGQQAEANFSLPEVPVFSVSGTVSGYAPNQGVSLQVFNQSNIADPMGYQFSEENGRFDFHAMPAGQYVLHATSSQGPNQLLLAEARFHLASDLYNLRLVLAPVSEVPVSVRMDAVANRPLPPAIASRIPNEPPPVSVRLVDSSPNAREWYATFDNTPNPRSLVFRNLEPGRYSALLNAQGGWYVASAEYGQSNVLTDDLVIVPGASPSTLNIVLRNDSSSLSGTVRVPEGTSTPATIIAVRDGAPHVSPHLTYYYPPRDKSAAAAPGFVLDGLAPGDYLVFAFDHAETLEYANPDVMRDYTSQATRITLAPGQRGRVALDLIRTGEGTN